MESDRIGMRVEAMMRFTIEQVEIPERPGTATFDAVQDVANALEIEVWGNQDFSLSPAMVLPGYQDQRFERRVLLAARLDGRVVGRGWLGYGLEPSASTASVNAGVLPEARGLGIGTALLRDLEERASAAGRPTVTTFTQHALADIPQHEPLLGASVGERVIPANAESTRFVRSRGYTLGQVERTNRCVLADILGEVPGILAVATSRSDDAYEIVHWLDRTPDDLVASMATAREHMATDVPAADLDVDAEIWTPERVRSHEQQLADAGHRALVVAAVHRSTKAIAGYSELVLPPGRQHAEQGDTLVLSAHRGHGLGLRLKAANLLALAEHDSERERVYTWNADENEHMLAINDRLGFRIIGYSGEWQRRLD